MLNMAKSTSYCGNIKVGLKTCGLFEIEIVFRRSSVVDSVIASSSDDDTAVSETTPTGKPGGTSVYIPEGDNTVALPDAWANIVWEPRYVALYFPFCLVQYSQNFFAKKKKSSQAP